VWSQAVSTSRRRREEVNGILRPIYLRVVAAYRTVSLDASLLAGLPHAHLLAQMRARIYARLRDLKAREAWTLREVKAIYSEEVILMRRQWELYMLRPGSAGTRTQGGDPSMYERLVR